MVLSKGNYNRILNVQAGQNWFTEGKNFEFRWFGSAFLLQ